MNWSEQDLRNYTQRRLAQEQRQRERMQALNRPHPDARRDEDGHCTVCGMEWPDEKLTLEKHICPPRFSRPVRRSSVECWRCKWQGLLADGEVCPICKQDDQLHEDTNAPQ